MVWVEYKLADRFVLHTREIRQTLEVTDLAICLYFFLVTLTIHKEKAFLIKKCYFFSSYLKMIIFVTYSVFIVTNRYLSHYKCSDLLTKNLKGPSNL